MRDFFIDGSLIESVCVLAFCFGFLFVDPVSVVGQSDENESVNLEEVVIRGEDDETPYAPPEQATVVRGGGPR